MRAWTTVLSSFFPHHSARHRQRLRRRCLMQSVGELGLTRVPCGSRQPSAELRGRAGRRSWSSQLDPVRRLVRREDEARVFIMSFTPKLPSHLGQGLTSSHVLSLVFPCCFWKSPFKVFVGTIGRKWGGWCWCVCGGGVGWGTGRVVQRALFLQ